MPSGPEEEATEVLGHVILVPGSKVLSRKRALARVFSANEMHHELHHAR